jgi:NAD(P)-dependent dehydrogenase (short-subunit alcohol dehydrogenase family)
MNHLKKTVLITGGTGALGHIVAERFLQEGATVASSYLFDNELSHLSESFRKNVFVVRGDVTEDEDVVALFQQVIKKFGKVDILINIVGGFLGGTPIAKVSTKDWDFMMNINLKSVFLCSREFLRNIDGRPYGRIINMAAMPVYKPSAGRGPYSVSKAGVVMATQVLGEELKGTGITANAIAPSILKTPSNIASMGEENANKWVEPEQVAETILFLCSDHAKSINGIVIPIFGGV